MKGTFTGTGRVFNEIEDGGITYVRGGKDKVGLLVLNFGTGTVALEVSIDKGTSWQTVESYTADTAKRVQLPDHKAIYTLNCSAYTADIDYSLSGK